MTRVLLTPLFGIGDMLMATPALRLLKEHRPDVHITAAVFNKGVADILQGNTSLDVIDYIPLLQLPKGKALGEIFRRYFRKYDVSLTLYPSNRKDYNLFSLLTGAPVRIGHRYREADIAELNFLKNKTVEEDDALHCVEENVRLLSFLGIEKTTEIGKMEIVLTAEEKQWAEEYISQLNPSKPILAIHAGCSIFKGHINRRLPPSTFAQVIDRAEEFDILLFGAKEDEEANNEILAAITRKKGVFSAKTPSLRHAAACLQRASLMLSNDSGLMHVAAAIGTPTIAVLGPTNKNYIYPWGVPYSIASLETPCSPCFRYSPSPLTCNQPNQFYCLKTMEADVVLRQVRQLWAQINEFQPK